MAGGQIKGIGRWKSAAIEYFFKPSVMCAAIWLNVFFRWSSPPKSENHKRILAAGEAAANEIWQNNPIMRYKMGLFLYPVAAFCEADNAYSIFFFRFLKKMGDLIP